MTGTGTDAAAGAMVAVEPAAMIAAAVQLEAVADSVLAAQHAHSPVLHAAPAGSEEVSLTVSRNQHVVADSFDVAARTGAEQLRAAADTLRTQAAAYASSDAAGAAAVEAQF